MDSQCSPSLKTFAIALLSPLLVASTASARNLILNGSFEAPGFAGSHAIYSAPSPGITNWTLSGPGNVVIHHSPFIGFDTGNPTFNFAHHGDYYLDLSGSGLPHATISQTVTTSIGQSYEFSFWIGAASETAPAPTIHVRLDGIANFVNVALAPAAPLTNINWTRHAFNFVADSTTTTLSFQGLSAKDDNASFVDACMIEAVPAPASALLLATGAAVPRRRRLR